MNEILKNYLLKIEKIEIKNELKIKKNRKNLRLFME